MKFYDEIKTIYVSAARMMAAASTSRVDLVASASASMNSQPQRIVTGYEDVSPSFAICLPDGERGVMSFLSPRSDGLRLESDDPAWITLEGWLPEHASDATSCFMEVRYAGDVPLVADVFLRSVDADGGSWDSAPVEWHLASNDISAVEVPLDGSATGRRKIVTHLRRPPPVMVLKSMTMMLV